jgi:hypothetical protein
VGHETYKNNHTVKEPGHPLVMHQKQTSYAPRLQKLAFKIHQKYQYKKGNVVALQIKSIQMSLNKAKKNKV